jgi:hypothetical protein
MNRSIDRPRLFSHLTRTRFFHIEDAIAQGKLRFFIGSFERGHGANNTAYAFLDIDDARVLMNDLSWGKPVDFVDRKGGKDSNDLVISRVLKIKTNEGKVWVELQNGEGEELFGGIVQPKGKPFAEISIPFTIYEGRKMAYACLAYMQAWDVYRWIRGDLACNACTRGVLRHTGVLR